MADSYLRVRFFSRAFITIQSSSPRKIAPSRPASDWRLAAISVAVAPKVLSPAICAAVPHPE